MDGMTDREYVEGVEEYMVVAGECPNAPAGSIVYVFPHVGWSEAGEVVALIAAEFQTAGGHGGAVEAGPVRVSRPRRARHRR